MWWIKSPNQKFSIPDWFSIYRIISAPFLIVFIFLDERIIFAVLLLISLLTDAVDGYLARKMKIVSQRGAQLDSIGDAITFCVGLGGVIKFETNFVLEHLIIIAIAFGLYIFQLLMAYWRYGMPSSFHTYLAKISAIFQAIFMLYLISFGVQMWLFYTAIILSIIETIEEVILIIILPKWIANVKGLLWVLYKKSKKSSF
jgi:CDP-diacylglycerol--glycerol-3-phosphate 3-phosphatidyltransferase